jgi:hypothetical protein
MVQIQVSAATGPAPGEVETPHGRNNNLADSSMAAPAVSAIDGPSFALSWAYFSTIVVIAGSINWLNQGRGIDRNDHAENQLFPMLI